jgi:ADP-heptose:LPS heptosyltransferase
VTALPAALDRIAVLRALPGLGDFLCAVPALRALRAAHPEAKISLIGLPSGASVVERFGHHVDELLAFPGFPGIPEAPVDPARTVAFLAGAQRRRFDLAIQLHGSGVASNPFVALLGARHTAGMFVPGRPVPDPDLFLAYRGDAPEPLRHLALMAFLGFPADDAALEFPLRPDDEAAWRRLAERHRFGDRPYVCVHAGAAERRRRWPAEGFAAVGDALARRGLAIVLTGSAREQGVTGSVASAMRAPAADLAGETALGPLAAVLSHATLTVTNDTGISHLAAAVKTPSAVIFSASDPRRWAPLDAARHRALGVPEVTAANVVATCDALLSEEA